MKKTTKLNKIPKNQFETFKNKWRFNMKNFKYLSSFLISIMLISCGDKKGGNDPVASNSKRLTSFSFVIPAVSGIINETAKTVVVNVPTGTNKTNLVAIFETTGVRTTVNGVEQDSSDTPNNFTNPVVYTIQAEDNSTVSYTVTVIVSALADKSITSFSINGINSGKMAQFAVNVKYHPILYLTSFN